MAREQLIPGPDHPITVTPTGQRVTVQVGDRTIADTTDALTLQEASYPAVQYLPLDSVDISVLRPSENTTYCPYKGEASYYSLVTDEGESTDAIWTYRRPYEAVAEIRDHVAFYPDKVEISIG
jgi:uncharacterized protein (DUF427 family)